MNRTINFLLFMLWGVSGLLAQSGKKGGSTLAEPVPAPGPSPVERYISIYHNALSNGDGQAATFAVYEILAQDPSLSSWEDTLSILYFKLGRYTECSFLTEKMLKKRPNDLGLLELRAVSLQTLGLSKDALTTYETLYSLSLNPHHLYEIATLQYSLKRFGECDLTVGRLLLDPKAATEMTTINYQAGAQQVPLAAAAHNLRGVVAMEVGKPEIAEVAFNEALKISPEFALAKGNLEAMKAQKK